MPNLAENFNPLFNSYLLPHPPHKKKILYHHSLRGYETQTNFSSNEENCHYAIQHKDNLTGHSKRKKKEEVNRRRGGKVILSTLLHSEQPKLHRDGHSECNRVKEWTGIDFANSTRATENRTGWRGFVARSSVVP